MRNFDSYVINTLGLKQYVRYVDDIVIISENKRKLIDSIPFIIKELQKTHQKISEKKTKIDTAYHGVNFLGKVSYPYGYQTSNKQVIKRTYQKARTLVFTDKDNLLAQTNSQIGTLKRYNCKKLIFNYIKMLPAEAMKVMKFDYRKMKFE